MRNVIALALFVASSLCAANNWIAEGNEAFYNLDYDQSLASYEQALAASPDDPDGNLAPVGDENLLHSRSSSSNGPFRRLPGPRSPAGVQSLTCDPGE